MQHAQPAAGPSIRHFLLLALALVVTLTGWFYLERTLWPPPEPEVVTEEVGRDAVAALGGTGLIGVDWVEAKAGSDYEPLVIRRDPIQVLASTGVTGIDWVRRRPGSRAPDRAIVQAAEPPVFIRMGRWDDEENPSALQVVLNTQGGAVQQVILSEFQHADWIGTGVYTDGPDGQAKKVPLHLIPGSKLPDEVLEDRDRYDFPKLKPGPVTDPDLLEQLMPASYVMFHYDNKTDDRPLDTLGVRHWRVVSQTTDPQADVHKVVFETELGAPHHVRIRKTFTLKHDEYHLGFKVEIEPLPGRQSRKNEFVYQISGPIGVPIEGEWYTWTYRNAYIGFDDAEGYATRDMFDAQQIAYTNGSKDIPASGKILRYVGVGVQYFASVLVVDDQQPDGRQTFLDYARATPAPGAVAPEGRANLLDITTRAVTEELPVDETTTHQYLLYQGPIKVSLLGQLENKDGSPAVSEALVERYHDTLHLNTLTDYHLPNWFSRQASKFYWTDLIVFTTNLMHWILGGLRQFLPLGLSILGLTILVRLLLFPLSRKQAINMATMQKKMAKMQPEMKDLKEKYKNDPAQLQRAMMGLYRKHNVNPLAMAGGCFLLILQMPIFMGLFWALKESIFFRLGDFLWIENLAAPDMAIWWGEGIPFISTPESQGSFVYLGPFLNVLPIVAAIMMLLQQKIMMPPPTDEQQAMQQSMMKFMMIFMGIVFYKMAAGVCIYFICTTLWGLAERKLLPKAVKPDESKPEPSASTPSRARSTTGTGTVTSAVARNGRKDSRKPSKGRAGKGSRAGQAEPAKPEPPQGMMAKFKAWLDDVMEQAKKK